jgi:hypothetical protein
MRKCSDSYKQASSEERGRREIQKVDREIRNEGIIVPI